MHYPEAAMIHTNRRSSSASGSQTPPSPMAHVQQHLPQTPALGGGALHVVFQSKLEFLQALFHHGHLPLHKHDVLRGRASIKPRRCHGASRKLTPCGPSVPSHKANNPHLKGKPWLIQVITLYNSSYRQDIFLVCSNRT